MIDVEVRQHISDLVTEEHSLRDRLAKGEISASDEQSRLSAVEIELDQLWDLLRQRDAQREFGRNPEDAQLRPAATVENYLG